MSSHRKELCTRRLSATLSLSPVGRATAGGSGFEPGEPAIGSRKVTRRVVCGAGMRLSTIACGSAGCAMFSFLTCGFLAALGLAGAGLPLAFFAPRADALGVTRVEPAGMRV